MLKTKTLHLAPLKDIVYKGSDSMDQAEIPLNLIYVKPNPKNEVSMQSNRRLNNDYLKERESRLKDSMWFQPWMYGLNLAYYMGVMPFRFAYDDTEHRYYLKYNQLQKRICIFLQLSSVNVMRANLARVVALIRTSEDPLIYFDLSLHFNVIVFGVWCKMLLLFRANTIEDLVNFMNESKLTAIASRATTKIRILIFAFFFVYTVPSGMCLYTIEWDMDPEKLDWAAWKKSIEDMADSQFSFLENSTWKTSGIVYPLILAYAFTCWTFELFGWFLVDITGIAAIFIIYNVAYDFFDYLKQKEKDHNDKKSLSQIYMYIGQYKELINKINQVFGINICIYCTYCTAYYSLHVVDMLASTNLPNRFLMSVQVGGLVICYYFASRIAILSRNINRWLNKKRRWTRMNKQHLELLQWDMRMERFSTGSFFKITPSFVGEMYSTLITIAVVAMGFRKTYGF